MRRSTAGPTRAPRCSCRNRSGSSRGRTAVWRPLCACNSDIGSRSGSGGLSRKIWKGESRMPRLRTVGPRRYSRCARRAPSETGSHNLSHFCSNLAIAASRQLCAYTQNTRRRKPLPFRRRACMRSQSRKKHGSPGRGLSRLKGRLAPSRPNTASFCKRLGTARRTTPPRRQNKRKSATTNGARCRTLLG